MTSEKLINCLAGNAMERLRWRVLREFSVLPSSRQAKRMSDADCLRFAAHMVLDMQGIGGAGEVSNPAFDEGRFAALKGGRA